MRIAHILNEIRFSGAEIMLESAAPFMQEFSTATIIAMGEKCGDFADRLEGAGYEIVHIPSRAGFGFFSDLRRFLMMGRFDLVHIHTERHAFAYSLACCLVGVPNLRTVHNEFLFSGPLRLRRTLTRQLARWLGTYHVACSRSVQRNEMRRFGLATTVIDNWLDIERITEITPDRRNVLRRHLGLNDRTLCTVSIANEAPAKNLHNLFAGVLAAAEQGMPIRHFHCGNIGPELQAIAHHSLGKIVAVGTVTDVGSYLGAADAFISSSYNEGGPLSLLEAAATGITSITTNVGVAEVFANEQAVRFIEPTADAITSEIMDVAKTSKLSRVEDAARLSAFARSYFNPRRGVAEYRALYENLAITSRESHDYE